MIRLVEVSAGFAEQIKEYAAEFPPDRLQATPDPDCIPGLDGLEQSADVYEWLAQCRKMAGKITWYLSVRASDGKIVGALVLRHSTEYDDDDPDFASHISYSVRPSEQRKGYGTEQLRLGLEKARAAGLDRVRLVCRDINTGSIGVIRANGGIYLDTVRGEESGMNIERYDIKMR